MCVLLSILIAPFVTTTAHAAMRGYIVTSFDTIRVEAPVRIVLTTGGGVNGSGEGDREALDRVNLSVSGGTLTVRMAEAPGGAQADDGTTPPPTLYLATGQIRHAMVLGGGVLTIKQLAALEADLALNGNGMLVADDLDVERLNLYVSGGGKMIVKGRTRALRASVNGPGALDASGLDARNATIANDGIGSIHATVHGPAKVVSTGSGDTVVDGSPICAITRRGIGTVRCGR